MNKEKHNGKHFELHTPPQWRCFCGSPQFHIFMSQAHPASRQGAVMIRCAECATVIMEQSGE